MGRRDPDQFTQSGDDNLAGLCYELVGGPGHLGVDHGDHVD